LDSGSPKEITFLDLVAIYRRRRTVIFTVTIGVFCLVFVYCLVATRYFQAIGVLQVQKESTDSLGLDSLMGGDVSDAASGSLDVNVALQTQAGILSSDTLALRTIEDLNLENNEDFRPKPISEFFDSLIPSGPEGAPGAPLENAPKRRRRLLKVFSKRLDIKTIAGTRLIEIDYLNPDPKVAAEVVNKLMQALADYNFQTRYDATNQASKWLNGQLGDLRKDAETLQAQVVELQRESGVYSLGTVDAQGREQAYSGVVDQLGQATQAMNAAIQARILKEAIARAADSGDAELLSGLAGTSAIPGINTSLAEIQQLRGQEAAQQAALKEALAKYGSGYPKLKQLRAALEATDRAIKDEADRIRSRADNDLIIGRNNESKLKAEYDKSKAAADKLNEKAIQYAIVRQEADDSRRLYEELLEKLKQAGVLEGLKSSNITVVDQGRAPYKVHKPSFPIYLGIALIGGFLLGCVSAFFIDLLDKNVQSIEDIEEISGEDVFGVLPEFRPGPRPSSAVIPSAVLVLLEPQSTFAESVRSLRTAVYLSKGGRPPKIILISSSIQAEGKTTISANLAAILAVQGKSVLLIDADLRRGALAGRFNLKKESGLSELLSGYAAEPTIRKIETIPGLSIVVAGTPPPNPAELLASESLKQWLKAWSEQYDFIIIDGPPVLPVTDAIILQQLSDLTILIARSQRTQRPQLERSFRMLRKSGSAPIVMVLNGLSQHDQSYYGYYGYYGYKKKAYSSGGDDNEKA
jgi:polysaccharide biosynthesis transport protein